MIFNPAFYKDYFDEIYYISPSCMNDETCWCLRDDTKQDITLIFKDFDTLDDIFLAIQEQQVQRLENLDEKEVLIVLDDCLNYLSKGFESLTSKFRHYHISIFVSIQNFRKLPITCRYNTTAWCFWNLNKKERSKVFEEFENVDDFERKYEIATKKKYNFLFYDVGEQNLYHNFGKLL